LDKQTQIDLVLDTVTTDILLMGVTNFDTEFKRKLYVLKL